MAKVRKEVRKLCVKMRNAEIDSKEWREASDELMRKWKFTPFNLLALYGSPPTIEYTSENMNLVLEDDDSRVKKG